MPLKDGSYKGPHWATRRAILELLKRRGSQSSAEMADELGVSSMAVRQHLQELEQAGDVVSNDESRGVGRPTKIWGLTNQAERHFPDRHRDLMLDLINSVKEVMGQAGMDKLLSQRAKEQISVYSKRVQSRSKLKQKVDELADIRSEEGYMAETQLESENSVLLIENHCPICSAAESCVGLCSVELDVFKKTLGKSVSVERVEHMISGDRRCAYRIKKVVS